MKKKREPYGWPKRDFFATDELSARDLAEGWQMCITEDCPDMPPNAVKNTPHAHKEAK